VFNTKMQFGFLGSYNPKVGQSPFERFYVGGSGLSGYQLDGRELIALRGYNDNSLTPRGGKANGYIGGSIFDKFTFELRYPISLNPQATIFLLAFAEAGNAWNDFKDFNPYAIKRSTGAGVRVFLPMFGLLGLDYGYGFDEIPGAPGVNKGQFHFSIGQQF
jgi:outer membrane protein insertion porin family